MRFRAVIKLIQARHLIRRKARHCLWLLRGYKFATDHARNKFKFVWSYYGCPVVNHPTQQELVRIKVENMRLAAEKIDGLVIMPGQIFSFWHLIGRPSRTSGFRAGPTFINGKLDISVGGGLCQVSGLIFNLVLEAGLRVLERHSHTLDAYGERRYLPLGRDATVAWMSKDLAFQNSSPYPICIEIVVEDHRTHGQITSVAPCPFEVKITIENGAKTVRGHTREHFLTRSTVYSDLTTPRRQDFESLYRLL